jgi:3-hydroxyacyl-[acyl-carrier-protein] dehydratase
MLLKDFYSVINHPGPETETNANGISSTLHRFTLELNPLHPVYSGHFPGNPIVPGVCQIMMIQEIIGLIQNKHMRLERADTVKFLSLIVPGQNSLLDLDISCRESDENKISANVTIHSGNTIFLKFKGTFSNS